MQKVKVRLPGTLAHFAQPLGTLTLAITRYVQVEMSIRVDDELIVETQGEGAGNFALGLHHPVTLATMRFFQHIEQAPSGLTIRINNNIPLHSGLGALSAFEMAGFVCANNIMGNPLTHEALIDLAVMHVADSGRSVAGLLGGLVTHTTLATTHTEKQVIYRSLPVMPFQFVLATVKPDAITTYPKPDALDYEHVKKQVEQLPLIIQALQEGNLDLLIALTKNTPRYTQNNNIINGYDHIAEVAYRAGASAILPQDNAPLIIFLGDNLQAIAEAVQQAFDNMQSSATVDILAVDTQGVVLSKMQSA